MRKSLAEIETNLGTSPQVILHELSCSATEFEERLLPALLTNRFLTRLELTSCSLNTSSLQKIAAWVEKHPTLTALTITDIRDNASDKELLLIPYFQALSPEEQQQLLGPPSCGLAPEAKEILLSIVRNNTTLTSVDFSGNILGDAWGKEVARLLHSNANHRLTKLVLNDTHLINDAMEWFGELLKADDTITTLSLAQNTFTILAAFAFQEALACNHSLISLNLSDTKIVDDHMTFLAEGLRENACLQNLELAANAIKEDGAIALGHALKENTALQRLDLRYNQITPDGFLGLYPLGIKKNRDSAIRDLQLGYNKKIFHCAYTATKEIATWHAKNSLC